MRASSLSLLARKMVSWSGYDSNVEGIIATGWFARADRMAGASSPPVTAWQLYRTGMANRRIGRM